MRRTLTIEELEERGEALRDAFPDMPHSGELLLDALTAAAALEDDDVATLPAVESD